jgi:hypothetical protein
MPPKKKAKKKALQAQLTITLECVPTQATTFMIEQSTPAREVGVWKEGREGGEGRRRRCVCLWLLHHQPTNPKTKPLTTHAHTHTHTRTHT